MQLRQLGPLRRLLGGRPVSARTPAVPAAAARCLSVRVAPSTRLEPQLERIISGLSRPQGKVRSLVEDFGNLQRVRVREVVAEHQFGAASCSCFALARQHRPHIFGVEWEKHPRAIVRRVDIG